MGRFVRTLLYCRVLLAVLLAIAGSSTRAQTPIPAHKVLTPEQKAYQAEAARWTADRMAFRKQAQAALAAETSREKKGDCPDAVSTLAFEQCYSREIDLTQKNYDAFTSAIRHMLGHAFPDMPGEPSSLSGPSGVPPTPAESVEEFDRLQADSKLYRKRAGTAAYNQFKGGTLAPVFAEEAAQRLVRLHMQELAFIYGNLLSNH